MNTELLRVSLRQGAVILPDDNGSDKRLSDAAGWLAANLSKLGYDVSEELLHALNAAPEQWNTAVLDLLREIMGVDNNWTPLVKGWNVPTGESVFDHLATLVNTAIRGKGTRMPCGHVIPAGSFPIGRYNGCPVCGTPFDLATLGPYKQGSRDKVLVLWRREDAAAFLENLLRSSTAPDATQADSLRILLKHFALPDGIPVRMRETLMIVIDSLVSSGKAQQAAALFATPADIMRYLWYRHTGFLQILEPKTIIRRNTRNGRHLHRPAEVSGAARLDAAAKLRLKYTRAECAMVAGWMNGLAMDAAKICEIMHPKRRMWVRFIRALRLTEWAKRPGFGLLSEVLDRFYRQDYPVWAGTVEQGRVRYDAATTFELLRQRPGAFARSLFANMLWFGGDETLEAFAGVAGKVPARLLLSLAMYAETYFDPAAARSVKPLGGAQKTVPANQLLKYQGGDTLRRMQQSVRSLCLGQMRGRYAALPAEAASVFIDPALYQIPVSIGDRSESVQDTPAALMGTRFPIEGNSIRLFMQWGVGMKAQHLDMDLSCVVAYADRADYCSYMQLAVTGCLHSGDIQAIPEMTGTAEYIELNLDTLRNASAQYVTFTSNAYSAGALSPNMVVGWMSSRYPMRISGQSGVAYDPSCVQHQVRITSRLTKGLVFGVLDVRAGEVIWLELPFDGQVVGVLDANGVDALLRKLRSKITVGELLELRATAQGTRIVPTAAAAAQAFPSTWAQDTAAVTALLID